MRASNNCTRSGSNVNHKVSRSWAGMEYEVTEIPNTLFASVKTMPVISRVSVPTLRKTSGAISVEPTNTSSITNGLSTTSPAPALTVRSTGITN